MLSLGTGDLADMAWEMKCREEDMKQRALDNERRAIDDARRLVDEKTNQLEVLANQSSVLAGFSMVVLAETTIPDDINPLLLSFFGITSTAVVSLMLVSTLTATYTMCAILKYDTARREMPFSDFWLKYCENDWRLALRSFTVGVPLFMSGLALLGWVVFWKNEAARYPASISVTFISFLTISLHLIHTHRKWQEWLLKSNVKILNPSA